MQTHARMFLLLLCPFAWGGCEQVHPAQQKDVRKIAQQLQERASLEHDEMLARLRALEDRVKELERARDDGPAT